ncbi:uncharacterized protein apol [Paramormyrops kingsleyae]|uniref:uncharacterized protein apol n=1 Tax=Paramormyrops kingsleyae TaxID=1676925 RepID=UPI003B96CF88
MDHLPVRLTGGTDTCSGRVEVYHSGSWGTVCDDSWDLRDAMVVCRQLGCGPALRAEGGGRFGRGDSAIWLDEVNCKGSELALWHCSYSLKPSDCSHRQDAWITCAELSPDVTRPPTVIYMQTGQSDSAMSSVVLWILTSVLLLLVVRLECMNWILLRDHRNKNETNGPWQHPAAEDLGQTPSGSRRIQGDSRHRQAQTTGTLREMTKLQLSVDDYISETLKYIEAIQVFLDKESEWFCKREEEMNKMKDIKKKANNMTIKLSIRMKKLEKELSAVVKDLISGLKELQPFLEALEKLAVTSPFVFDERLCWLPAGNTVTDVFSFIHAARMSCGLLVHFKKDIENFFQPNLVIVEILVSELQRMIGFSKDICEIMEKRCKNIVFPRWNSGRQHTCLQFYLHLSPDAVNMMSNHVNNLSKIRANEDFRLTYMFGDEEKSLKFIDVLSEQKPKILGSLTQMEACAVQLDKMKKGADISGVAGSTVGVGAGVVSIVGLALAPVTLGASTILTVIGGGSGSC